MCNSPLDTLCLAALEKLFGVSIHDGYVLTSLDSILLLLTYCGIGALLDQPYIESFCPLFRDARSLPLSRKEPRKG